jgi:hypothetical protein
MSFLQHLLFLFIVLKDLTIHQFFKSYFMSFPYYQDLKQIDIYLAQFFMQK